MVLSKVEGHTSNADLTIVCHGGGCPDLSGPACALLLGHETKKDITMLYSEFLSWITLKRHSASSRSTFRLSTGSWPRGSVGVIFYNANTPMEFFFDIVPERM
jgi:hypothetical protein